MSCGNSDLFASHTNKSTAILLIDASGSTVSDLNFFNDSGSNVSNVNNLNYKLIFDKIVDIIKTFKEENFRVVFWNSDQERVAPSKFVKGIFKLPFIVTKNTLPLAFQTVKPDIDQFCLTFPHLGFESIPAEWINLDSITKIYFITDGQIGYGNIGSYDLTNLKSKLVKSIKSLFGKYSNVQLHIITVEPKKTDFTEIESLTRAAGCDVYNAIMDNQLTKYISKFVSYTPNNLGGFVHINKNIPPPGFIPYEDKYFSELRTNEFLEYIYGEISQARNENELLKIVQSLSSTVCALTKDKPQNIVSGILKTFCDLFNRTILDTMFVKLILEDAVRKENDGMANIFASYRAKLRDLYKQANDLLLKNVKEAIGINDFCVGFPIDDKIVSSYYRLIEKNISIDNINYPQAALFVNDIHLPVFPLNPDRISLMNEQCLRQWIRALVHKVYGVNALEDIVIYIVLSMVLRVVVSDVDESLKDCYRQLGTIMLKKKRTNSDTTELARLEDGQLPTPNSGKIEVFYGYMETVKRILNLNVRPMTLWYILCLALGNTKLITKQLLHSKDFLEEDFPGFDHQELLSLIKDQIKPYTYYKIPFENVLDYTCVVTMDDTSATGGYRFLRHKNQQGLSCSPVYVLSENGYNSLLAIPETSYCPICFTKLSNIDFQKVDPKPLELSDLNIFPSGTTDVFSPNSRYKAYTPQVTVNNVINNNNNSNNYNNNNNNNNNNNYNNNNNNNNINTYNNKSFTISKPLSIVSKLDKIGTLVMMKGTVGSGKTTYSAKLKEALEAKGYHCTVVGTDKYCKMGTPINEAVSLVKNDILQINLVNEKPIVLIVDTCGDRNNKNELFGFNFSSWKCISVFPNCCRSNMDGYLSWSLRNVLLRCKPTESSSHYLNPETAGINCCLAVHQKKAQLLFGKKIPKISLKSIDCREDAVSGLNEKADEYQKYLEKEMVLETEIDKIVNKITRQ